MSSETAAGCIEVTVDKPSGLPRFPKGHFHPLSHGLICQHLACCQKDALVTMHNIVHLPQEDTLIAVPLS
ncbi:MAG: hypothetical protein F6K42_03220 [Leptolyngbya sp. SIO1D8]|nr:hypothetical protein [Leptolyngbya sp. SIO1D8]